MQFLLKWYNMSYSYVRWGDVLSEPFGLLAVVQIKSNFILNIQYIIYKSYTIAGCLKTDQQAWMRRTHRTIIVDPWSILFILFTVCLIFLYSIYTTSFDTDKLHNERHSFSVYDIKTYLLNAIMQKRLSVKFTCHLLLNELLSKIPALIKHSIYSSI